jgi:hypothetical protein
MSPTGRSFAELSYLHEDLLLAMTEQVVSTLLLGRDFVELPRKVL